MTILNIIKVMLILPTLLALVYIGIRNYDYAYRESRSVAEPQREL